MGLFLSELTVAGFHKDENGKFISGFVGRKIKLKLGTWDGGGRRDFFIFKSNSGACSCSAGGEEGKEF